MFSVSIINFKTFEEDGITYLKLHNENVELNEKFKIYITSFMSKPVFNPDISNKVKSEGH